MKFRKKSLISRTLAVFFLSLIAIFLPSAVLEWPLFYYVYDYQYFLTAFVGFIVNFQLYVFHRRFWVLYAFNLLFYLYLTLICVARVFHFNVFEFVSRWDYLIYLDFSLVAKGGLLIIAVAGLLYLSSKFQKRIIAKIDQRDFLPNTIASIAIIALLIVWRPMLENRKFWRFQASHNGFGHDLKRDYVNYFTDFQFEKFPDGNSLAIDRFYNTDNSKDFLLILESWGKLQDVKLDADYLKLFVEEVNSQYPFIQAHYVLKVDSSKFYGSSVASEARELFNGNSDNSYLYYMNTENPVLQFNLVEEKKRKNYYLVAGYSSSGKFGVNGSNVIDFRRRLGFDQIFTTENMNLEMNVNSEIEGFGSVYDEVMIDTLLSYANQHKKYFGYAFTSNTHFPFIYNAENPYIKRTLEMSSVKLILDASIGQRSKELIIRILATLNHMFSTIDKNQILLDGLVAVGDHSPPVNKDYSRTTVPALILEKK